MTSSSSTALLLLIALGGLFIGAIFMCVGWYLWYEGRDLRNYGHTVTATVLRKFRKHDQGLLGQLENYYLRCAFQDTTGLMHEVEVSLQSKRWFQVREGNTAQLTYVPADPDETQFGSHFDWKVRGIVGIIIMGLGVVAIAVFTVGGMLEWLQTM